MLLAVMVLPVGPADDARPRIERDVTTLGDLGRTGFAAAAVDDHDHGDEAHSAPAGLRVPVDGSAQMLALDWDGGDADAVAIRVRTADGWGDRITLGVAADEGADPGTFEAAATPGVGPLWVGEGAVEVELSVPHGRLQGLRLHEMTSVEPEPSRFSVPAAAATAEQPAVLPRSAWGANEEITNASEGCENAPSYASNVSVAFVHHTVTTNAYTSAEADDLIRGIHEFHVNGRGYCDVGYNFIVDRYGRAWEGRSGGIGRAVIGAHSGGFNSYSTGVALLGDHAAGGVTSAARTAVADLLSWKLSHHGVDPAAWATVTSLGSSRYSRGTDVTIRTISGHRDVSATACPGGHAYNLINSLRTQVSRKVVAAEPYPMAGYRPAAATDEPSLMALDGWGGLAPRGSGVPLDGPWWYGWQPVGRAYVASTPTGGYVVDAWGGVHAVGDAPKVKASRWFAGQDVVRGAAPGPDPASGFVLDGFGGVYPFGGNPLIRQDRKWPWMIGRGIDTVADGSGGYVLDGWGGIHTFGAVPRLRPSGYWKGWDIARDLALLPDGTGGYVLDGWGGLHPFGDAEKLSVSHYTPHRDEHVALALNATGTGGWVLDDSGRLWPFGDAPSVRQPRTTIGHRFFRDVALAPPVVDPDSDDDDGLTFP